MGKVIQFPKQPEQNQTKPRNVEEYHRSIKDFRQSYIDDVSEFMLNIVMVETGRAGFDLDEEDIKDVILVGESIKSLMMKKNGMHHILQEFADDYHQGILTEESEDDTLVAENED